MQTIIRKWGNSAGARIPASVLNAVGLNIDDAVDIEIVDNSIVLRAGIQNKSVEELLALSPAGSFELTDDDKLWLNSAPVGQEVI